MLRSALTFTFLLVSLVALVGCSSNKLLKRSDKSESASTEQADITRPPVAIGAKREVAVETNPDETISFEEWKRRQTQNQEDPQL